MSPSPALKENLHERIRNRFNVGQADAIIAMLKMAGSNRDSSQDAVRDASWLVNRYRVQARAAIRNYREWQAEKAGSEILQALRDQEGRVLLGHARAMSSLYLDALRDHRDLISLSVSQYGDTQALDKEKARQPERLHGLCSKE
jgi:hypothetical protein